MSTVKMPTPPIVYTIAGSDSVGGAGIQADLHAIHSMNCHGCSAITCLTAQSSVGVSGVHAPDPSFLKQQLDTIYDDLPPRAIKIGMLGTRELTEVVGNFLKQVKSRSNDKVWVVLDPVMISTSGSKLLEDDAIEAMIENIFPLADIITPNKFEAEALLKRELKTPGDVENGARDLLMLGCKAVLLKGGHTLIESKASSSEEEVPAEIQATLKYSQDYLLTAEEPPAEEDERLCDGCRGVWLRTPRWDSENTHGTGCTLSSAIAAAVALGENERKTAESPKGSLSSIQIIDACCLAKAYVSSGIQRGVQLGKGPGPVAQTGFPSTYQNFPCIAMDPASDFQDFRPMHSFQRSPESKDGVPILGRILPIVDTIEWVERLSKTPGVTDIQLRIKDETDPDRIADRAQKCEEMCREHGVRLWINDHWRAAVKAGCFGVHVGQEDLVQCMKAGGLEELKKANIALGISTHSYGELAAALAVKPTYISLGPVFATSSKKVQFDPQGLDTVARWRKLIPPEIPFVTIGGIGGVDAAMANREAGADCVAVIGAVTSAEDVPGTVAKLNDAMQ